MDNWSRADDRSGQTVFLRADRWFQANPNGHPEVNNRDSDFAGICINIWNRDKIRRFQTHSLVGGGDVSACYVDYTESVYLLRNYISIGVDELSWIIKDFKIG